MKVSIIVPLYNKKKYIKSTIQSVLSQTFNDWEILIVDNGSTDGSIEEAKTVEDMRVKYLISPIRGVCAARNYGLNFAKGEWIQFLDADDLLESSHLSNMLEVAECHPHADIIACGWQEFIDDLPDQRVIKRPLGENISSTLLRDGAIAYAPWAVHAALVKRAIMTPDNYWSVAFDKYLAEDIVFWFNLVSQFSVAYCNSAGALYRIQTNGRSQGAHSIEWYKGIDFAIKYNINGLKQKNITLTLGQSEILTRIYTNLCRLSIENQLFHLTNELSIEATFWLNMWFNLSNEFRISLLLRKIFGIVFFACVEILLLSLRRLFL